MEYMFLPLKRYADFSGRSRRKEYWMFALFYFLLLGALFVFSDVTGSGGDRFSSPFIILFAIAILALIVPSIAVQVRRFHDQDKSGWFVLLNFVPYVGGIIVLVFMCLEGTRGENRYGPDPKHSALDVGDIFS